MRTVLEIYFATSICLTSYSRGDEHLTGAHFALMLLVCPFIFSYFIFEEKFGNIFSLLQVNFFFQYWFTKKWNDLDIEDLVRRNNIAQNHFASNSVKDQIYRYCPRLINKKNNFPEFKM